MNKAEKTAGASRKAPAELYVVMWGINSRAF